MTFSPLDNACIQVKSDDTVDMQINTEQKFNYKLLVSLVCGLFLLLLSPALSKSAIFQYTSGAFIFIVGGLLVVVLFLSKRIVFGSKNQGMSTQLGGMFALITGSYGATIMWFLRTYFRSICLKYPEVGMVYIVSMIFSGLSFIRLLRKNDDLKHVLRVSVKWLLRLFGIVFIFNSTASPMISLLFLVVLFVFYIIHMISKWLNSRLMKEVKKIKKKN